MSIMPVDNRNIFTTTCQTLVNTINCVGFMGAGLALECRLRFPEMYERYVGLCETRMIAVGKLWLWKGTDIWILNFPTKNHWKEPSREEYLHSGLSKFMETYKGKGITSVAFPLLGSRNGGIEPHRSKEIMMSYLQHCEIPVEIHEHDPSAPDDMYDGFKEMLLGMRPETIREHTGIRRDIIGKLLAAMADPEIRQLNQLAQAQGIGIKTLERVFRFAMSGKQSGSQVEQAIMDLG